MIKAQPRIAVLLAAYQGIRWIEEQINSILSQKAVHVTLFISVDACPENIKEDGTLALCKQVSEKYENVHLLPYGQRFGRAGANFFRLFKDVDLSSFDAVSLSDQDDIWFEAKLARAWEFLSQGRCQAYSSNVIAFWPDGRRKVIKKSYPQSRYDYLFEAAGPGCTYVFNRDIALKLQDFLMEHTNDLSSVALHDWLSYAYCRQQGVVWHIDNQATMLYRQHSDNEVGVNEGFSAHIKRFKLVSQHYYRNQVEVITRLVFPDLTSKLQSRFFLLSNCLRFRRRPRDRFALLIMFLLCIY